MVWGSKDNYKKAPRLHLTACSISFFGHNTAKIQRYYSIVLPAFYFARCSTKTKHHEGHVGCGFAVLQVLLGGREMRAIDNEKASDGVRLVIIEAGSLCRQSTCEAALAQLVTSRVMIPTTSISVIV